MDALFLPAALDLASRGWRVFPCEEKGKKPLVKAWQLEATTSQAKIEEWWTRWPRANIAVVLGPGSGIIDAECDSKEEEQELLELFDGEPQATATFYSSVDAKTGYQKKHFLFIHRSDLPAAAVQKLGKLMVRIGGGHKGAYSIFPPSVHPSGAAYAWRAHPDMAPPAVLPDAVVTKLHNLKGASPSEAKVAGDNGKSDEEWDKILGGVREGSRNTDMTSYCGWLFSQAQDIKSRKSIRGLWQTVGAVNERNQPPLAAKELDVIFRSILSREQRKRTAEEAGEILPEHPGEESEENTTGQKPSIFTLTIIHSDPPRYELKAPQFRKAPNSSLVLAAEQMVSPRAIRIQALKQAEYPLPKSFDKAWSKPGGLYESVIFHALHLDAEPEEIRSAVIAERLLTALSRARILQPNDSPDPAAPCAMPDGSVVFLFRPVWEAMSFGADKITRPELSGVLKECGASWYDAGKLKFKQLDINAQSRLEQIATKRPARRPVSAREGESNDPSRTNCEPGVDVNSEPQVVDTKEVKCNVS